MAPAAAAADSGICIVADPCQKEGPAQQLATTLRSDGLAGNPARRAALVTIYRVTIDGFTDLAEADGTASRLRRHGLNNLLVYRFRADGAPRISLGVFREPSDAAQRSEQAQLLGFDPKIDTEHDSVSRWYVGVEKTANAAAIAVTVETAPRIANCMSDRSAGSEMTITNGSSAVSRSRKIAEADAPPPG